MLAEAMHSKRTESVANATTGLIQAGRLGVSAIGHGLAMAKGLEVKHAIKQVDRLLSNGKLDVWKLFGVWVPYAVGSRNEIVVALDWTEFDHDDQSTIALHLVTRHGRATPLMWLTVVKSELAGWRNAHEDRLLGRLREVLPEGVQVTVLADRGFGDAKLYGLLEELCFDYIIRFRENIAVEDAHGESRPAAQWVPVNGRPKMLKEACSARRPVHAGRGRCKEEGLIGGRSARRALRGRPAKRKALLLPLELCYTASDGQVLHGEASRRKKPRSQ